MPAAGKATRVCQPQLWGGAAPTPCCGVLGSVTSRALLSLRPGPLLAAPALLRTMSPPNASAGVCDAALFHRTTVKAAAAAKSACSSTQNRALAAAAAAAGATPAPSAAAAAAPQLLFTASAAPGHFMPGHVEQPARVDVILQKLREAGITSGAFAGQVRSHWGDDMSGWSAHMLWACRRGAALGNARIVLNRLVLPGICLARFMSADPASRAASRPATGHLSRINPHTHTHPCLPP